MRNFEMEHFSPHGRVWEEYEFVLFMNYQCILRRSYMQGGRMRNSEMETFSQHGRILKEYDFDFEHYYMYLLVLNNVRE